MGETSETLRQWQETAAFWAEHRNTISRMFSPLTRALIEQARIREGDTVLDIAGGTGEPSLTIAEAVRPGGSVTCTDAVEEMVETAEQEARSRGLTNIQFRQCSAEALPFPDDTFDVVVSRFGAMFFPEEAFREILRVTKPAGTIAFAVWCDSALNPFCHLATEVMSRHVESPAPDPNAPGAFRFAEEGKLAGILKEAGATDLHECIFKFNIAAPLSPTEFWQMRSSISETLRTKLASLSVTERSQIATEIEVAVKEFFPDNQMKFPTQMLIVSGRKPN